MGQIKQLVKAYIIILLLFVIQKPIFMLIAQGAATQPLEGNIFSLMPAVMWHGLTLDRSMTSYLCALPCLLLLFSVWIRQELIRPVLNLYYGIAAALIAFTFVLNLALYPYWNFPLDSTPLFYFFSSPKDALASTSILQPLFGLLITCLLTVGIWFLLRIPKPKNARYALDRHRARTSLFLLICLPLLFLGIRGGVTVSTANSGKVYFSQNNFINHAAVNPMFCLLESLTHQTDFVNQYRFMDDKEATKLFGTLVSTSDENTYPLLNANAKNPDILIVIMEGFANDLMSSLGGKHKEVAVNLDSIAQNSILFTRFYANSFRTDRGLVSILSGYPAQPTSSIMKFPAKSGQLPSIAKTLQQSRGYKSAYYYGGDVDFANQRSYLISQGYQNIISDQNFPIEDKLSKWGVPDHLVANKLLADLKQSKGRPWLRIFQTSSSHEPFDVPYNRLKDKRLNAFAYTDSVVGSMMRQYAKMPRWKNTLVILVPDHVGGYTEHLDNFDRQRYQIPLIMTGGAIARPMKIKLIGSQHDIAGTLLGQLKLKHDDFKFSKNMLSDQTPKFAFFTVPDAFGMVTEENSLIYDNKQQKTVYDKGNQPGRNLKYGQAYLQKLYDDLASK